MIVSYINIAKQLASYIAIRQVCWFEGSSMNVDWVATPVAIYQLWHVGEL